ncbi:MAG TPA: DUF3048 domain-containing protein [Phototrophicaceae bacterium]|jgi:hypothetical protein|nr:DUF3048 domain-containing protein [Phototrophicaceae bacterium]
MRRALSLLFALVFSLAGLMLTGSETVFSQTFVTNTPRPTKIVFVTNTPDFSPTPSFTPTLTNTPTFTPTDTPSPTLTPSPTATVVGPAVYPDGFNSLTGLQYPNEEAQNRRNLMVKISNYPPIVRPQSGINLADVVFEYEVEGGVTRFAAIFRTNAPTHVGPVRSGRLVDLQLAPMYNALWAYSGSSQPIMDIVLDGEQTPWGYNIFSPQFGDNCEDAGFCRFPKDDLPFEHTLYLDTTLLWAKATRRGVNLPERAKGFAFSLDPVPSDGKTNDIYVDWYGHTSARWQFDPTSDHYLRFTDGVPHLDALDNSQLWADNIVIIQADHHERPDLFEPESKSASQEIALWNDPDGYYPALVMRDGVYYQGYWERKDRELGSALQLKFNNGDPIMLKPGRTWVMIVRGVGDVVLSEQYADMAATSTTIAASATPKSAG